MELIFEDWGFIDYRVALSRQEQLVEAVRNHERTNSIIFCSHPAIVTKGRATKPDDILDWKGPIEEVNRGGRATYHGPSQIMIYPIISLMKASENRSARDIGAFLRGLENALVATLSDYGIQAKGKTFQPHSPTLSGKEETGVWVLEKKVASIGLSIRHWITYHGAALNFDHDPLAFKGLSPCGFHSSIMTSVEEILGFPPDKLFLMDCLQRRLQEFL